LQPRELVHRPALGLAAAKLVGEGEQMLGVEPEDFGPQSLWLALGSWMVLSLMHSSRALVRITMLLVRFVKMPARPWAGYVRTERVVGWERGKVDVFAVREMARFQRTG
jgi:hypothetical protein